MQVHKDIINIDNTCVAFGEFDCIHKGHREIIKTVTDNAEKHNLKSVIISIPKSGQVFYTEDEKEYLLKDLNIDYLFTNIKQSQNIEDMIKRVGAKIIVVGENNKDIENLKYISKKYDIKLVIIDSVKYNNEIISKSLIKKSFEKCDYETMTQLLGQPYMMLGNVVHGKALGRTVGMPTANLQVPDNKIKPLSGVYCTSIILENETFKAMTNIGKRPSVDNYDYVTIEAFILDFSRDIYGKKLIIEVHKFVRGVVKFDNLEQVQAQVQKDITEVRNILDKII